jgi:hypothetical protein
VAAVGRALEQRPAHLRTAGVVEADEEDVRHLITILRMGANLQRRAGGGEGAMKWVSGVKP